MITNFEEITQELNELELKIIPVLIKGFESHNEEDPIKSKDIVNKMNNYLIVQNIKLTMTDARLRKCCNYIRSNGLIPLIATSKGYFVTSDKEIIKSQIKSLQERANSILTSAKGIEKFI